MWILMGLFVGVVIGTILPPNFSPPYAYSKYISVSLIAGIDSVLGAVRAGIEEKFHLNIFVSGFLTNALLAAFLTWIGDRVGIDLYLAAVITFGVRVFNNLGYIRRDILAGGKRETA
ncbi:MAG: small basic family protein [Candidatus Eremiobacteraeota bacterium]|nr:small basic family protein [Candidatus Eremiobacteraeota bacterium]